MANSKEQAEWRESVAAAGLRGLHELLDERFERLEAQLKRITNLLDGGDRPADGLLMQVDRLRQRERERAEREKRRDGRLWAAVVAAIGAAVAAIAQLFGFKL